MSRNWAAIRQEIRQLCHKIGVALEEGRRLDSIRPRPGDCGLAMQALFNTLAGWPWPGPACLSFAEAERVEPELPLHELIYDVCKTGDLSPGMVWGTLLELIEAKAVRPFLRQPVEGWRINLNKGEAQVHLATTPEKLNIYKCILNRVESEIEYHATPSIPIPIWNRTRRELSFGGRVCLCYKRDAPTQFAVLEAFQERGWPESIKNPLTNDSNAKQCAYDIIKRMLDSNIFHISYTQSSDQFLWKCLRAKDLEV